MKEERPYTNRDLAVDYLKLVNSVFPNINMEEHKRIAGAIDKLEIDLPLIYRQYGHIPKLTQYGIGPIARRGLLEILQYGVENVVRIGQEELFEVSKQIQEDLRHTQKVSIDTLVDKFVADSGITGELANNTKKKFVLGMKRMYREIMKGLPHETQIDYALPVKIIGADDNSYAVQWVKRYRNQYGIVINDTFFVHNAPTDEVSQKEIIAWVPEHLHPEFEYYKIDELINIMEKRGYDTQPFRVLKGEFTPQELEDVVGSNQYEVNNLLTREQIRDINLLGANTIKRPKFREVSPDQYMKDILADKVGLLTMVLPRFRRMRRE